MPNFKKDTRGFKMKGWSAFTKKMAKEKTFTEMQDNPKKPVKKSKERVDPTWMGTDEYRNPEDIPASEYLERGLNPADYIPGYKKKDIQIPRKK